MQFSRLTKKEQRDIICLGLALLSLVVYFQVICFGFVNFDDPGYVYLNPHVSGGLSLSDFKWAFTTLTGDIAYWHPVTWLSHQLDYQMFGPTAMSHHLVSVLIHTLNTVLVYLFVRHLSESPLPAAFVALFFSVHPLHVESVAWIAERKDLLFSMFYLFGILLYFRYTLKATVGNYALVCVAFGLSLMSKPMAVTFPFVLLLLDVWPLQRIGNISDRRTRVRLGLLKVLIEKVPLLVVAGVGCYLAIKAQRSLGAIIPDGYLNFSERVANASVSYSTYLRKTLIPNDLCVLYLLPGKRTLTEIMISALVLCVISALAIGQRKRLPILLFGWLWFLGTMIPAIGLIQAGSQSMADRYTYLPLIGVFLMVWGSIFSGNARAFVRIAGVIGGTILTLPMIFITQRQLWTWEDSRSLFEQVLFVEPRNYVAQYNLGSELCRLGRIDDAEMHYRAAIAVNPGLAVAHENLGQILLSIGRPLQAAEQYHEALKDPRESGRAHAGLANAYASIGRPNEAVNHFEKALAMRPDLTEAQDGLAWLLATASDPALRNGERALTLATSLCQSPNPQRAEFLDTLAAALAEAGRYPDAARAAAFALMRARSLHQLELCSQIESRRRSYESNKPFHAERAYDHFLVNTGKRSN